VFLKSSAPDTSEEYYEGKCTIFSDVGYLGNWSQLFLALLC